MRRTLKGQLSKDTISEKMTPCHYILGDPEWDLMVSRMLLPDSLLVQAGTRYVGTRYFPAVTRLLAAPLLKV